MLRLATNRPEVSVVADQRGNPSYAPDIANIIFTIARNLREKPGCANLRGILHMAGGGETDWASFAEKIFRESAIRGGPFAVVRRITSNDYPTAAKRPANSRLDFTKLRIVHGVAMRDWRDALSSCMDKMMREGKGLTL
jgi:dTDP-4-dehydrorhamnose reductase